MSLRFPYLAVITLLSVLLPATVACTQQRETSLQKASANFDLKDVEPFLASVAKLVDSGFDLAAAKDLAGKIAKQPVDSEHEYEYSVVVEGAQTPLRIVVFMDDVDAPDMAFYARAKLANRIDAAMRQYFEDASK